MSESDHDQIRFLKTEDVYTQKTACQPISFIMLCSIGSDLDPDTIYKVIMDNPAVKTRLAQGNGISTSQMVDIARGMIANGSLPIKSVELDQISFDSLSNPPYTVPIRCLRQPDGTMKTFNNGHRLTVFDNSEGMLKYYDPLSGKTNQISPTELEAYSIKESQLIRVTR